MSSLPVIQEWLEASANSPVTIWCDDPETHKEKIAGGLGGKTYLSYRILYKQSGRDVVGVRHRYSEFEQMRNELKDRYHSLGVLVPALPPKHQMQNVTTAFVQGSKMIDLPFVKERTFGLTLFCEVRCLFTVLFSPTNTGHFSVLFTLAVHFFRTSSLFHG